MAQITKYYEILDRFLGKDGEVHGGEILIFYGLNKVAVSHEGRWVSHMNHTICEVIVPDEGECVIIKISDFVKWQKRI